MSNFFCLQPNNLSLKLADANYSSEKSVHSSTGTAQSLEELQLS
jgi:hypothetical protein